MMDRLVSAAEAVAGRSNKNHNKYSYIGCFVSETLQELNENVANEGIIAIMDLLRDLKQKQMGTEVIDTSESN